MPRLKILIHSCLYLLGNLIPKRRNLWLFGAWFGQRYCDNPRALFELALQSPGIEAVWISRNRELCRQLQARNLPAAYFLSPRGLWLQLRAGAIIYTHAHFAEFYHALIGRQTRRIQTWHGTPLKMIGRDDRFARQTQNLPLYLQDHCDLMLACGEPDQQIFRRAFNVRAEDVVITGYPRNDALARMPAAQARPPRRLLYMPTFRGQPGSEFPLLDLQHFPLQQIEQQLARCQASLHIRLHPVQTLSAHRRQQLQACTRIQLLEGPEDIYQLLQDFDALITDYSSIYFDFLLSGRPVYLLPIDQQHYLRNDREFYYDYREITPSEPQHSWPALLDYIFTASYPQERHQQLCQRMHQFHDDRASERALALIRQRVLQERPAVQLRHSRQPYRLSPLLRLYRRRLRQLQRPAASRQRTQ